MTQAVHFNTGLAEYTGAQKEMHEKAYGHYIGIFNVTAFSFKPGCDVNSTAEPAEEGQFDAVFKATLPPEFFDDALTAANTLSGEGLIQSFSAVHEKFLALNAEKLAQINKAIEGMVITTRYEYPNGTLKVEKEFGNSTKTMKEYSSRLEYESSEEYRLEHKDDAAPDDPPAVPAGLPAPDDIKDGDAHTTLESPSSSLQGDLRSAQASSSSSSNEGEL